MLGRTYSRNEDLEFTPVSISFDDGSSIQYQKFYPILAELEMTATFYIVTSQIGKLGKMTWGELEHLYAEGNEIGSHTHTHAHLAALSSPELDYELSTSKSLLDPFECRTLAYPFGEYNDEVVDCAKRYYVAARSYYDPTNVGRDVGYNQGLASERYALKVFPTERAVAPETSALLDMPISVFHRAIERLVGTAIEKQAWLVFVFHGTSDMSLGNILDNMRARLGATISRGTDVRRVAKDLMHYYGGMQAKKFKWMCQYFVDNDCVRTLTICRAIQCLGVATEVQTELDTVTDIKW